MYSSIFNKVDTNELELSQLKEAFTTYFNLLSLFFPSAVNITVWTVAYAIPYHAQLFYDKYKVGYGSLSLQAKSPNILVSRMILHLLTVLVRQELWENGFK